MTRAALLAVLALFMFALWTAGCGRSSLEQETLTDGGPGEDGAACGPSTCPGGCCDSSGVCRSGGDVQTCGSLGQQCTDCLANGYDSCDPTTRACGTTVTTCDAASCPNGCCAGSSVCLSGTDPNACGTGGAACQQCANQGQTCDPRTGECGGITCSPQNCPGCCVGSQCLVGTSNSTCGTKGSRCQNCAAQGTSCQPTSPSGGICEGPPKCGPGNCTGCCVGNTCVSGSDNTACGSGGGACANCAGTGRICAPPGGPNPRTCQLPPTCGPSNCAGCCSNNACIIATTNLKCGAGGQACKTCGPTETCNAGVCTPTAACGPGNCSGCCIGDICAVGTQDTACGLTGILCQNCAGQGKVCQGGACQQPACGPGNCAGCCSGNTCVIGTQDAACGKAGGVCADCTPAGQVCSAGVCKTPCGPANCTGCCSGQQCVFGATNSACGQGGIACVNCTAAGSTCDALLRVCANQQNTCPAPYAACPAGITTQVLAKQAGACSTAELADAQAACSTGPDSGTCAAYFQFEQAMDPACAACLAPFDYPFDSLEGIYECISPFVTAACNRSTGCEIDCENTSCNQCPALQKAQCEATVQGGQCQTFVQQTICVLGPINSAAGRFCHPGTYGGNYGSWLQGVGAHYCGP